MDYVAQRLGMSKRTLYEIFGSKDEMLSEVIVDNRTRHGAKIREIMEKTTNMMEAIANVFLFHIDLMRDINAKFFFDMDVRYHTLRDKYEESAHFSKYMIEACRAGVRQGVFRPDVNYPVTIEMVRVQMESLKRMRGIFFSRRHQHRGSSRHYRHRFPPEHRFAQGYGMPRQDQPEIRLPAPPGRRFRQRHLTDRTCTAINRDKIKTAL